MKFNDTLNTCVSKVLENNRIPMLLGEPGIGKSSWLECLATQMHTKCFTLPCNQLADKADLTGARLVPYEKEVKHSDGTITTETDYKQVFYPHAVIQDAIDYAKTHPRETPLLFLDEINRTEAGVTSELLSIPTLREIGKEKLPNNLRVVIAGNDKGNVTALDSASISRFVLFRVEPDTQTFLSIHKDLNPFIANVLKEHPETIFCKTVNVVASESSSQNSNNDDEDIMIEDIIDESDDMLQLTTPRSIAALSDWLNSFSNQELMSLLSDIRVIDGREVSTLEECIDGHVGHTNFSIFLLSEITNNIMSVDTQANATTVGKPACYDDMKACSDIQSLDDMIADMSPEDMSGCLLYAMYEKEDNALYIEHLSSVITQFIPNDLSTLMSLCSQNQLDSENVHAFLETNTPLSNALSMVLSIAN